MKKSELEEMIRQSMLEENQSTLPNNVKESIKGMRTDGSIDTELEDAIGNLVNSKDEAMDAIEYIAQEWGINIQSDGLGVDITEAKKDKESLEEGSEDQYPSFELNKNIKYQDMRITSGYWTYTGKESGGRGVYLNVMNQQRLGFNVDDINFFKTRLPNHFKLEDLGHFKLEEAKKDKEEEEDIEIEDIEDIEDTEEVEDIEVEDTEEEEIATPSEEGISGDEKKVQDSLESALIAAKELGDEKLINQIGNSITFFTRSHVVGSGEENLEEEVESYQEDLYERKKMLKIAGIIK